VKAMYEIEVALTFYTTIFFTALYVIKKTLLFGVLTFATWWILGLVWLLINSTQTSLYSIGIFFNVVGWIFFLVVMVQIIQSIRMRNYEESELD